MLTNILIAVGMSCALGTAFNNANAHNFINNDIPNNVVYDDVSYTITLSVDELNNYTWVNLSTYLLDLHSNSGDCVDDVFGSFTYNETQFSPVDNSIIYSTYLYFSFTDDVSHIDFGTDDNSEFTDRFVYEGNINSFEYDLILESNYYFYDDVKSAIELDIASNTNTTPSTQDFISILGEMIGLLTGGLTGFATGIGSGVQTLVSSLFIASNGTSLSVFGAVICIFGGIALAIGLSRLIFQWIASIGAKH